DESPSADLGIRAEHQLRTGGRAGNADRRRDAFTPGCAATVELAFGVAGGVYPLDRGHDRVCVLSGGSTAVPDHHAQDTADGVPDPHGVHEPEADPRGDLGIDAVYRLLRNQGWTVD